MHTYLSRMPALPLVLVALAACIAVGCDKEQPSGDDAPAESCPAGKVDVDGHCCFHGQTWSAKDQACSGPPTCPDDTSYREGCPPGELDDASRVRWLRTACDADTQPACGLLASHYLIGNGVEKSAETARKLANSACEAEVWNACNTMGTLAIQAGDSAENANQAREYFSTACDNEDGEGCKNLALVYARGIGVRPDQKRARSLYRRARELGFEPACKVVERMEKMDESKAQGVLERARAACDQGDQTACARAGGLLLYGRAGEHDVEAALELLDASCGSGVGRACRTLATAYYAGEQVTANPTRALDFAERGCSLDESDACNIMGLLYLLPRGPSPDIAKSRDVLGRACEAGNPRACSNLGRAMLEEAAGVEVDAARARELFEGACENDIADACARYADLLEEGRGGDAAPEKAAELRQRACDLGADQACD